jgi:hypothetical protein
MAPSGRLRLKQTWSVPPEGLLWAESLRPDRLEQHMQPRNDTNLCIEGETDAGVRSACVL